jgi:hypothetical protein
MADPRPFLIRTADSHPHSVPDVCVSSNIGKLKITLSLPPSDELQAHCHQAVTEESFVHYNRQA